MLITISNRLPFSVVKKDASISYVPSVGGLATGLAQFHKSAPSAWVGWPGISLSKINGKEQESIRARLKEESCHPIFLSGYEVENFYQGFANKTIWPLFHYFPLYTSYSKTHWASYRKVNEKFAEAAARIVRPGDTVWIHDYHLLLLPEMLRRLKPEASVGFFLHIPFPSFELFRLLPWREEILRGLLGADLVGFHTYSYGQHFLKSVSQILYIEHGQWQIPVENRIVRIDAFPMGIDFERFVSAVSIPRVRNELAKTKKQCSGRKIILSVDRLDYTKGIPQRLEAFELFLERNPRWREKVTFILLAVPSRTAVSTYAHLKREVDELVGRINGRFGTIGWVPIQYLYRYLPFESLTSYYLAADVMLVTPLRDGMNLIAKEYLAVRTEADGVLILSEMAGAAQELGDALLVNPNNTDTIAEAIKTALAMPREEQVKRNELMRKRIGNYTVSRWANEFLAGLAQAKKAQQVLQAHVLDEQNRNELLRNFRRAKRRLLLLDYDGSLVPFFPKPELAEPDEELAGLLKGLAADRRTCVVIVSGRDAPTLDNWFGRLNMGLIAEHGALLKKKGSGWQAVELIREDWKQEVRGLLEQYTDRTPGAFFEEKKYSLVWHYRNVNEERSSLRVRELKALLRPMIADMGIEILEGNKVLEVRTTGLNKGRAVFRVIQDGEWDFILSMGDDRTDEDVFAILPVGAYSIKVGLGQTAARFNIEGVEAARGLLSELRS